VSSGVDFGKLFVAMPTPFDERGRVDEKALERLLEYVMNRDIDGLALLTEAAEDCVLSDAERRSIVELVGSRARDRKEILVAVSAIATQDARDLAYFAESHGATGLLVNAPRVPGMGYRELYRYIDRLGRATELPMYLVSRAENTIDWLAPEEMAALSQHPRLGGILIGERSPDLIRAWAKRFKGRKPRIMGPCAFDFGTSARAGANAVVCGMSVLGVEQATAMMRAAKENDVRQVAAIEKRFAPAMDLIGPPVAADNSDLLRRIGARIARRPLSGATLPLMYPAGLIKAGLCLQGHTLQPLVRPPFESVQPEVSARLNLVLRSTGLLS
jgi:4-hydroxy-tetrahydrodipicolinate synthase